MTDDDETYFIQFQKINWDSLQLHSTPTLIECMESIEPPRNKKKKKSKLKKKTSVDKESIRIVYLTVTGCIVER